MSDEDIGRGITKHSLGTPSDPDRYTRYVRGRFVAWYCKKGWAVAETIEKRYTKHRYHKELSDALDDLAGQPD